MCVCRNAGSASCALLPTFESATNTLPCAKIDSIFSKFWLNGADNGADNGTDNGAPLLTCFEGSYFVDSCAANMRLREKDQTCIFGTYGIHPTLEKCKIVNGCIFLFESIHQFQLQQVLFYWYEKQKIIFHAHETFGGI